jgi:hypothetical protein
MALEGVIDDREGKLPSLLIYSPTEDIKEARRKE